MTQKPAPSGAPDAPPSGTADPLSDPASRWPYERRRPYAQALARARAKIGPATWEAWSALADIHGVEALAAAAEALPPDQRWPDRVEARLLADRKPLTSDPVLAAFLLTGEAPK